MERKLYEFPGLNWSVGLFVVGLRGQPLNNKFPRSPPALFPRPAWFCFVLLALILAWRSFQTLFIFGGILLTKLKTHTWGRCHASINSNGCLGCAERIASCANRSCKALWSIITMGHVETGFFFLDLILFFFALLFLFFLFLVFFLIFSSFFVLFFKFSLFSLIFYSFFFIFSLILIFLISFNSFFFKITNY